tara:strand:+ start:85 stop:378 length:294 start_codon:yes stop_codon:yes gene_type:complete
VKKIDHSNHGSKEKQTIGNQCPTHTICSTKLRVGQHSRKEGKTNQTNDGEGKTKDDRQRTKHYSDSKSRRVNKKMKKQIPTKSVITIYYDSNPVKSK